MTIRFHNKLGGLVLSEGKGRFVSFAEFAPSRPLEIRVYLEPGEAMTDQLLDRFAVWMEIVRKHEGALKLAIAEDSYGDYVENWAEGEPMTRASFMEGHRLDSITFSTNGVEAHYYSEPFLGHHMVVEMAEPPHIDQVSMFG